jgi:hypothetical protein
MEQDLNLGTLMVLPMTLGQGGLWNVLSPLPVFFLSGPSMRTLTAGTTLTSVPVKRAGD